MPETQFATTLIVCLKGGVALLVSAGTALRRWHTEVFSQEIERTRRLFAPQLGV
jgi:hypothetical protein